MTKNRLEAFSDGVMAIIITIMVLEMKIPHGGGDTLESLLPILPVFLSYVLSFSMVLIYWNNHHHLFQSIKHVNGKILLANGFLLFCLSLMPFTTAWMGENHFTAVPVALFGIVLLFSAIAFFILVRTLISLHGTNSVLAKAVGRDYKSLISLVGYAVAVAIAIFIPLVSCLIYIAIAIMWLIPDKRIEHVLEE